MLQGSGVMTGQVSDGRCATFHRCSAGRLTVMYAPGGFIAMCGTVQEMHVELLNLRVRFNQTINGKNGYSLK